MKNFKDTATKSAQKFISTQHTEDTQDTQATPTFYRLNLKLDTRLRDYLADEAWYKRTSITQLVNEILTDYSEKNPHEGRNN